MRLPEGWDTELKNIGGRIDRVEEENLSLLDAMEKEVAQVRKKYDSQLKNPQKLTDERGRILAEIRNRPEIVHPERKSEFATFAEAASVLAHYWQGEDFEEEVLLKKICSDMDVFKEAEGYAINFTESNSPEGEYVDKASSELWTDSLRGR